MFTDFTSELMFYRVNELGMNEIKEIESILRHLSSH